MREQSREWASPRAIHVREDERVPAEGLAFGFGAMLPFPPALAAVWLGSAALAEAALLGVQIWGAAILVFLGGVRRGLSFRTEGGPRRRQIAMALWLFVGGLAAGLLPPLPGVALLLAGYVSLLLLDPAAARRGEAPLYFQRLRPVQMTIPAVCVAPILPALV